MHLLPGSMGFYGARIPVRVNFRGHQALGSLTKANHNVLARPKLSEAETPEGFHVNEDVFFVAGDETVTLGPVELGRMVSLANSRG